MAIAKYMVGENRWDYSRGRVTEVASGRAIADIKRNYCHFWHSWVNHVNGCEYLLCGEDYQGYSVINLTQREVHTYFPEGGYNGSGFCWAAAYASPDSQVLEVDGCIWACHYELKFYDLWDPDAVPLAKLFAYAPENNWYLDDCEGWVDTQTFALFLKTDVRKSDGVPYGALSEEAQAKLDADWSLMGTDRKRVLVTRQHFGRAARVR